VTTAETTSPLTPAADAAPVKIAVAKGRPMLSWVGKRPLGLVTAFPAQAVERFDPQHVLGTEQADAYTNGGLLFHGDNKEVLAHLLASGFRGKVNLIYIDPPFDSGADYVRKVSLRGGGTGAKLEGETYTLGEQTQYTDIWANDNYLQFMYERLLMLKELLAEDGSIYLHCDWHKSHYLRCLMDEIFGKENIQNEIVWKRTSARSDSHTFNHIHDVILFYSKSNGLLFNETYLPHDVSYIDRYYIYKETDGRRFATIDATQAGLTKSGESGKPWRGFDPASKGNHWKFKTSQLDDLDKQGRIYWPQKEGGWPRLKSYLDETKGAAIQSIWTDLKAVNSQAEERGDYPTQKPEALLERVINASSNPGDIVLDCFIGSGTTAAVAQKLGRRWIGCDINKGAIQTASKRLQGIITAQSTQNASAAKKGKAKATQQKLDVDDTAGVDDTATEVPATTQPAQSAFSIWRVNDFDLQIQHNEAVQIACQHLGVTRTKGDSFFDGTRGQQLVKIVPFNHPLSPLDLEEVKIALENRPDETRSVLMVCLGVELAAQGWIEDWNRMRKIGSPHRIDYIEMRTDPKYGKFFEHKPASAQVSVTRDGKTGRVKIENFVSPTILERLAQAAGVLSPRIDDWRAMADCVLIDTNYDGSVFNVVLSDVPEKKNDLVAGEYELTLPQTPTLVGVKIIDMLGEEVLETVQV